ncbi:hypothetical protein M8J75_013509 [Diaphorina citri]|nr:hypothetical protein M8J75_013509 [Diaphorina citri]
MGNSSSSHREPPPSHSWTLSYPRPNQKVLPDRYPGQRLRVTNNGVLLHTVGTLNRHAYGYPVPVSRFGSEPDLRFTGREFMTYAPPPPAHHSTDSPSKQRISRSRKKYKAPTPLSNGVDSSSPESYQAWDTSAENSEVHAPPTRKSRLFKTHAETKGPANRLSKVPPLHRSLSSPQFHEELLEATQKLRRQQRLENQRASSPGVHSNQNHLDTVHSNHLDSVPSNQNLDSVHSNQLDSNHSNSTNPGQPPPRQNRAVRENQIKPNIRQPANSQYVYNKENRPCNGNQEMRELVKEETVKSNWENIKPVKTFYFGMGEEDEDHQRHQNQINQNEVDMERFAASIHRLSPVSDSVDEEDINNISLHLRPTLPRKQLDIPRFSPTAAWRLLSSLESPPLSHQSGGEEDDLVVPHVTDKSAAWTPQQDLEETSSDGGLESSPVSPEAILGAPTFSLSLPRDATNAKQSFAMLHPHNGWMADHPPGPGSREGAGSSLVDENWVLSRSVPSSLHLQRWGTGGDPVEGDLAGHSLPYFASRHSGRVMYLPEYQPSRTPHSMQDLSAFSKSCDDLVMTSQPTSRPHAEDTTTTETELDSPRVSLKQKKHKKFTFQSTVRQIERRRIAEKLSKQAEQKERQRLMELETMQRVEAEFQRKREREKADIRQQLRLYTHVLSEYKQPSRDYKDYTPNITRTDVPESPPSQVIHPQVVYQMPKNTQVYVVANGGPTNNNTPSTLSDSSNYRRDFAQGVMPRPGSELSQPISHRSSSQEDVSKDKMDSDPPNQHTKQEVFPAPSELKLPLTTLHQVETPKPIKPSPVLTSLLTPFDRNKVYRPISFTPNATSTQLAS